MEMGKASLLFAAMLTCGCAETLPVKGEGAPEIAAPSADARAIAHDHALPSRVVVDDFWLDQQIAAMSEPPAIRPRSISLGYAGDSPLSGGVMRDDGR